MSSTSGVSELDTSSYSGSPAYYSESPQSSPSQQVPQLITNFTGETVKRVYAFGNNDLKPYLRITEQPQSHFRFRYDTEKSGTTHGCLLAKSYVEKKVKEKTFPTVELVNYHEKAVIKCSIKYPNKNKNHQEAYRILEDNEGTSSFEVPQKNCYKVGFRGIGIHYKKKTDLATLLYSKRSEQIPRNKLDVKELRAQCDTLSKAMNLNIVQLEFSAFTPDGEAICDPVLSDQILNSKNSSTNALNICRMNAHSGLARGGEDLFLLVDKIDKKDVKVVFFEEDEHGNRRWSADSYFALNEVHYQCVIICRTPAYEDPHPAVDVPVYVQLVRLSDERSVSEPKPFVYKADETYKQIKKRKMTKPWPAFPDTPADVVSTPVKIAQPNILQYKRAQRPCQIPNRNIIPQTVTKKVIPQPIESTTSNEWSIITNVLDTALDNSSEQSRIAVQDTTQGTFVQTQGGIQTVLEGDMELQRAFDVYKTAQSRGALESQELMEAQNTFDIDIAQLHVTDTNLHVIDESLGLIELQAPNGTHEAILEGNVQLLHDLEELDSQEAIVSQDTEIQGVESSPMWGQVQLNYQPQAIVAQASKQTKLDTEPMSMEEDISQAWFAEYENLFKILETDSNSKNKNLSYVSDSGRVKPEMKTSSTQTENDNENRETGAIESVEEESKDSISVEESKVDEVKSGKVVRGKENEETDTKANMKIEVDDESQEIQSVGEINIIIKDNPEAKLDEPAQECAKLMSAELLMAEQKEDATIGDSKDTNVNATERSIPKLEPITVTDHETTNVSPIEIKTITYEANECGYSDTTEKNANDEENAVLNTKKSLNASTSRTEQTSDSDYPIEFSPEDAVKVKKLVQELAEIVRAKKSGATETIRNKLQELLDIRRTNGDTFLHMALFESQQSFIALVKMISSVKMPHLLNAGNALGETILHLAVVQGSAELVALLVDRGCEPMARTAEEDTCLHYAVRYGNEHTLRALLDAGERRRAPLHLDAANAERCTALHLCALHARAACAELLCARGAALGARDAAGRTPLHLCALDARVDVARALLAHAAPRDVEARDARRRSALALVCARRPTSPELARLLLAHGARAPPAMPAHPLLAPLLADFLTQEQLDALPTQYESETDEDSEYESADDESIAGSECLASRLEELELFDDAEY